MEENRRRDTSLRVRLSADMMSRFEALASRYGMPASTLAAFAVARFVLSEEANLSLARMAVLDVARRSFDRFEGPEGEAALQAAATAALHALTANEIERACVPEKAGLSVSSAAPQAAARPQRSEGETG